jgi:hypothetical protein
MSFIINQIDHETIIRNECIFETGDSAVACATNLISFH